LRSSAPQKNTENSNVSSDPKRFQQLWKRYYLVRLRRSLPFAIEAPEGPLELIAGELSSERLKAYRRPNRAVFVNSTVDVGRSALKLCLA
jgi:hypothetical protein